MQIHAQAYDPLFENPDDLLQLIIDLKLTDDQTIQYIREIIKDKQNINEYKQLLEKLKVKIPKYQNIQIKLIKLAEVFPIIKDNVIYPDISSNWIPYKVFTETQLLQFFE